MISKYKISERKLQLRYVIRDKIQSETNSVQDKIQAETNTVRDKIQSKKIFLTIGKKFSDCILSWTEFVMDFQCTFLSCLGPFNAYHH